MIGKVKAIYPGSFDPPTLGHLDIIQRASHLFSQVVVAVGINAQKPGFLPVADRLSALTDCTSAFPNVEVTSFPGLLVEFAREVNASVIVRGLRATSDFDFEFQIAMANRRLDPNIETVCLLTKWENSFVSSSVVREIATLGGDFSKFVPEGVMPWIRKKIESSGT